MKLYNFQRNGVNWLDKVNGIGLLLDEMGLGKSCQAVTYCKINTELRPVLVICPASLKLNWQREIEKWSNEESYIIYGKKSSYIPSYPWYIINYDILAEEMKIGNK